MGSSVTSDQIMYCAALDEYALHFVLTTAFLDVDAIEADDRDTLAHEMTVPLYGYHSSHLRRSSLSKTH